MKRFFWLSVLAAVSLGQLMADPGDKGVKGPPEGVRPAVVDTRSLPPGGGNPGRAFQTPLGYEVSQGHNEDLKISFPSQGTLGGNLNYDSNTGTPPPSAPGQGSNYQGMTQNGWIPYDAALAVGPNDVVVMTNSQWAVYSKTSGTQRFITQFDPFFGNAAGGGFDPKCFYDAAAGKWVLMVVEESNPKALIDIAVSQGSDPATTSWWVYHFDVTRDGSTQTSNWMDFPGLGYDNSAVYVGGDMYSFSSTYRYSKVRVFKKTDLYNGSASSWVDFVDLRNADGTSAFAPKPAFSVSSSASEYIVNTRPGGGSSLTLWRVDNGGTGTPALTRVSTVSVGQYAVPPDAKQPNTGQLVATGDCRTQDVVFRGGYLYTGFTEKIGNNRRNAVAAVRYLKLSSGGSKVNDISYTASNIFMYYPAVIADGSGNMYMTFSRSSSSEYASMYRTGMLTTDGAIQASALVKPGVGPNTSGRWGDYSAAAPDPSNGNAVWLYGGWANSSNRWATWIAGVSFSTPLPAIADAGTDALTARPAVDRSGLIGNYPNPFNPVTTIQYGLRGQASVHLSIYNALGQNVRELIDGTEGAGYHEVKFDASGLASGVYFYRLQIRSIDPVESGAENFVETKKLVLMR